MKQSMQFDTYETDVQSTGNRGVLHDLTDEVAGYKRQYAWSKSSITRLNSDNGSVTSFNGITTSWVGGLREGKTNSLVYSGLPSTRINGSTTADEVERAHGMSLFNYPALNSMRIPIQYRHCSVIYLLQDQNLTVTKMR